MRFAKRKILFYGLTALICGLIIFPLYWMFLSSVQSENNLFHFPPFFLPYPIRFKNYVEIFQIRPILLWLKNSLIVSFSSLIPVLIVSVPAGYSLSRFRYRTQNLQAFLILSGEMIPHVLLVIPLFRIFKQFGLLNKLISLIIMNGTICVPMSIWIMRGFFDTIPREIEEAALIDGCSRWRVILAVVLPLSYPVLIAVITITFLTAWEEFLFPLVLISENDKWVNSVGLRSFFGELVTPWGQVMATAVFFTIPIIILFLILQKYIISGLSMGAVKG
jgi:multiple sugar transport system permease protein